MILYILPCILGLAIKGYLLFITRKRRLGDNVFFGLVTVMAVHNFCELFGYLQFFQGSVPEIILRTYYALTVLSLTYIVLYAIDVSRLGILKKLAVPVYSIALLLCLAFIFTDALVAGSTLNAYTIVAVKGEQYWAFKAISTVSFMLITASLVVGYLKSEDSIHANQCLYALLALSPIILVSSLLLVLMSVGVHYSIAVIMPLCTATFVVIIVRSESKHNMTDIRRLLPFSVERSTSESMKGAINKFLIEDMSYRETQAQIEKILINHAMRKKDNNITHAADRLGVKRTTLHTWLKRIKEPK